MIYQIYEEGTAEIVAQIDTESDNAIVTEGYGIIQGDDLRLYADIDHEKRKDERAVDVITRLLGGLGD